MQKWIILGVVLIIVIAGMFIALNVDVETDYTPEIEIDETNLRKTMISLYFLNKETHELEKETRLIDSKELIKEPYKKVVNMLIEGPQNEDLEPLMGNNVEVKEISLDKNVLNISFSSNFLENIGDEIIANKVITAISNTLKEFKEIDSVNIVIDGNQ